MPFYNPLRESDTMELTWPGGSIHAIARQDPTEDYQNRAFFASAEGWFGGTGARTASGSSPSGHGDHVTPYTHTPRSITLRLAYAFPTFIQATEMEHKLSGILPRGEVGELAITRDGHTLYAGVIRDGEIQFDRRSQSILFVEIPLLAADPFKYERPQITTIYPEGMGSGLKWDKPGNLFGTAGFIDWHQTTPVNPILFNSGNAEAWPTIRFEGSAPDGLIFEMGGFGALVLPPWTPNGTPVIWDTRYSRVTRAGKDISHLANLLISEPVPPGGQLQMRLYTPGSPTSDYWATVSLRSTYL